MPDGLGSPNGSQASPKSPQGQSKPRFPSIVNCFCLICCWFCYQMGYFLCGLPHYFFGYLELSFSNFWPQVQMCWGRPQGSVRSQKSAMWPTFCLACLSVFVTSSPTFQVSGHRFFGVVSRVISELRSTARWRECRRQLRLETLGPPKASLVGEKEKFAPWFSWISIGSQKGWQVWSFPSSESICS